MIMLYPWMKRIIYWPQLFLGFTMNMGFIVGLTATETSFSIAALFIYLGLVCWTFGYDTIYGFQDVDDDRLIGVKSASLKVHQYPKRFIAFLYSISLLSWIGAGVLISLPSNYYLFIIGIGFLLSWQVFTLNIKDSDNCLKRFQSNQWVGILLWLGFVLSK
jgi:4-hydroxybenzoate polyprenyltransferase